MTLLDRRNFHLFQPLLYQVATSGLSPGDIASPLRRTLRKKANVRVLLGDALDIDLEERRIGLSDGSIPYDTLIVATGTNHDYFGNDRWAGIAPGLKTIEDATEVRKRILFAFESAERTADAEERRAWLTFSIVGGGPTGVELAGALSEIANDTLKGEFHAIDPAEAEIILFEGGSRILPGFHPDLSARAQQTLERRGVFVRTGTMVIDMNANSILVRSNDSEDTVMSKTVLWAAGVRATSFGRMLGKETGAQVDGAGRIIVKADMSVPGHAEIFVVGDLALYRDDRGRTLPAIAPVAIQQGRHVARIIRDRLRGREPAPFRYRGWGLLATIGRAYAVGEFGRLRLSGYPAWLLWLFVHLMKLVGYENRVLVLVQWAWNYFTRNRSTRLIVGEDRLPPTEE